MLWHGSWISRISAVWDHSVSSCHACDLSGAQWQCRVPVYECKNSSGQPVVTSGG